MEIDFLQVLRVLTVEVLLTLRKGLLVVSDLHTRPGDRGDAETSSALGLVTSRL